MHAIRKEILPPSGVEFAASLKLTPSTDATRQEFVTRTICNLVVARSNLLRIFDVREESAQADERRSRVRRGMDGVEGEVEMDWTGERVVSSVKSTAPRLYFVREHRLHGMVTGLEGVQTMSSAEDGLDRLLISFKDAKIALLEWSDAVHDLVTISIHTYERAPQLTGSDLLLFRAQLRADPSSLCAGLLLPKDAIAILPFLQAAELDAMDQDSDQPAKEIPYSPSFILDLGAEVDESVRNVIDFAFLPGFNNPTIAVLFQTLQTWTGRLKEYKDTCKLLIFTLDLTTHTYPIITSVPSLPYDCLSLVPCTTSLGGLVIISANAVVYVDQAARRVVLPINGWAGRISDVPLPALTPDDQGRNLELEGSRAAFVDDRTFFLILRDGTVYPVELVTDGGKTVSKLSMGPPLANTTVPALVRPVGNDCLFVGSTVGPSVLLQAARVQEVDQAQGMKTAVVNIVLDDDDDIYGDSPLTASPTHQNSDIKTRTVVHLSLCDSLPGYGAISDMKFSLAKNGEKLVPELVAATGSSPLGGFTLFQRDLPIRGKRKLHAIGGARGMWSLPVRQNAKVNGVAYKNPECDSVIMSTDANPSPGLSRIACRSGKVDITITTRIPGTTVGAAAFFGKTAILHVMTNAIRVLEPDGTERQIIKDVDGNMPRPKIRACSICDPFVLVIREDDSIGLFIGEQERGKIRRKDMSPMGEKSSRYLAGCFFSDASKGLETRTSDPAVATTLPAGTLSQWLILIRPQGTLEIWTLPKLSLVFSTAQLSTLQNVITDSYEGVALSLPQDPPRKPQELDVEQVVVAPLGETYPRLHLLVFLRSGQLTIYEVHASNPTDQPPPGARPSSLLIKFVKVLSQAFDIQRSPELEKGIGILSEQKRISHLLIPFVTSPTPGTTLSGVFFTGDRPSWILATNKTGIRIHPSGMAVVHAFTTCSLWDNKGDFLLYSDEGPSLLEWMSDVQLDYPLPSRSIPCSRAYSNVVFDPSTSLIVAASVLKARFTSFDEEGNKIWEPDAPNVSDPATDCSTLELISPDLWITMDGYEFAQNESVTALDCVTLETSSTETGSKDFIAVGTTINRGEDLAAKGATYIFEIVEVIPDPSMASKRWYKLKLCFRDDSKGPVTAICGFNGYVVSSMGQKIFVRALDLDERLVGVAFLDVGVYVTCLRTLKNLLLIGDAVKSVWFVAFQEDPYKLVVLARDVRRVCVTSADFFFADEEMAIITGDEEGIVRVYEYNPTDPESKNGQHLLCRTEFHGQVEYRSSVMIARRAKADAALPQVKLLCGSADGSLTSLTPVDEGAFKRLQLLQGQLTRNIQHIAGLNPKALRIVKNDFVSKPLSKGVLDGNLLAMFESLPIPRQDEMTRQIGTERSVVLHDWTSLGGAW